MFENILSRADLVCMFASDRFPKVRNVEFSIESLKSYLGNFCFPRAF